MKSDDNGAASRIEKKLFPSRQDNNWIFKSTNFILSHSNINAVLLSTTHQKVEHVLRAAVFYGVDIGVVRHSPGSRELFIRQRS